MRILILSTAFRPDTAIAAKRPYMFAKYLAENGHAVTVVWSGQISKSWDKSHNKETGFTVISYTGEIRQTKQRLTKRDIMFLPLPIINTIFKLVHTIKIPLIIYRARKNMYSHFRLIKNVIDSFEPKSFDIVFSTYGGLANILAGQYASRKFNCKWVLDFRDRIVQPDNQNWLWNYSFSKFESKAYRSADIVTTVSDDLFHYSKYPQEKRRTIYNGYSSDNVLVSDFIYKTKEFSICYTGTVVSFRIFAVKYLFNIIRKMINSRQLNYDLVRIKYVGHDGGEFAKVASEFGLQGNIVDYGYMDLNSTYKIQMESDLFLVLSENTKKYQGILTGKFYEGIRCRKPILSIIYGNTPNSELYRLNEKYHYGYCYEICRAKLMEDSFRSFLISMYNQKINNGKVNFELSKDLIEKFDYKNLTKELECIFKNLLKEK